MAREHAPSIIFMDEIDSIGGQRQDGESGGDSEVQRTMLELLNQVCWPLACRDVLSGVVVRGTRGHFLARCEASVFGCVGERAKRPLLEVADRPPGWPATHH